MSSDGQRNVDARIEDAVKRMQADGDTHYTSLVHELGFGVSNEEPLLLSRLWDMLPDNQRPIAVASAWTGSDSPETILPTEQWLTMFRAVGYIEDTRESWPPSWPPPPPTLKIKLWRGGVRKTGMSWTADRESAVRFQHRQYDVPDWKPGKLWTATVSANHLLARFHILRPTENEYVVDPEGLDPIEVPDEAPE
ncbi:hypothetical protein [Mycobacterium parmense]|uniref:Uncharacterized protein n=1 Tax=Mycobacterium parmense TaxID=185642 RepID=A0A7I7YU78_9MYCO|nr:hypothetical protein [Mycobacterium parmense]MCV7351128.1 hypothetical protein [Mycobacterium parmense]ORW60686.1 hypothetical protein AWC20_06885 [Mycobacterium parmense]BBZ45428.1 hypothetical protein MPRM_27090 [Mycobacterium parmense]